MRLSDERLAVLIRRNDDQINPEVREILIELKQMRSALAADRERVRSVLADVLRAAHQLPQTRYADTDAFIDEVATRAAEQLATAGVGLSKEERNHLLSIKSQLSYSANLWRAELATIDRLLGASK